MLPSTVLGLALSCASALGGLVGPESLPVFIINDESGVSSNSLLDYEAVPALVAHFLGDGSASLSEENSAVLRYVPSRFLQDDHSAIVMVHGFDQTLAESKLGSPGFYLEEQSFEGLQGRAVKSSVGKLEKHISNAHDQIVSLDAVQDGTNYNERILDLVEAIDSARIMLIGVPEPAGHAGAEARQAVAAKAVQSNFSYVQIPDFFKSEEECVSVTKDCSNHGSCVKSSNGRYACLCEASVVDHYTYYWGGNDCSKRDVSFQFNLIVGTTLAIVVVSVLSVGLLFNLGSEPLPGVLNQSTL